MSPKLKKENRFKFLGRAFFFFSVCCFFEMVNFCDWYRVHSLFIYIFFPFLINNNMDLIDYRNGIWKSRTIFFQCMLDIMISRLANATRTLISTRILRLLKWRSRDLPNKSLILIVLLFLSKTKLYILILMVIPIEIKFTFVTPLVAFVYLCTSLPFFILHVLNRVDSKPVDPSTFLPPVSMFHPSQLLSNQLMHS